MQLLWNNWRQVAAKFHKASKRLLFFDYDGSLAPLVRNPAEAHLDPGMRGNLKLLAHRPHCHVGIISGRALTFLRPHIGLPELSYAGNHGFEIQSAQKTWIHPAALKAQAKLRKLTAKLRKVVKAIPGVIIENKKWTVSVHYRKADAKGKKIAVHRVREVCDTYRGLNPFTILREKQSLDIRPGVGWNKGSAVLYLAEPYPADTFLFYIGDDTTDEDAFAVVRKRGIAIRVGHLKGSQATYYVRDQSETSRLIQRLLEL